MTLQPMRLSWREILRLIGAHYVASILAGGALALVRIALSIPSPPDIGIWFLLWYLASVQVSIVGGAAAALAIVTVSAAPRVHRIAFPAAGIVTALVLSVAVEQLNLTFVVPAMIAGGIYGEALRRLIWRPRPAAP